jgi:hypothetical protein
MPKVKVKYQVSFQRTTNKQMFKMDQTTVDVNTIDKLIQQLKDMKTNIENNKLTPVTTQENKDVTILPVLHENKQAVLKLEGYDQHSEIKSSNSPSKRNNYNTLKSAVLYLSKSTITCEEFCNQISGVIDNFNKYIPKTQKVGLANVFTLTVSFLHYMGLKNKLGDLNQDSLLALVDLLLLGMEGTYSGTQQYNRICSDLQKSFVLLYNDQPLLGLDRNPKHSGDNLEICNIALHHLAGMILVRLYSLVYKYKSFPDHIPIDELCAEQGPKYIVNDKLHVEYRHRLLNICSVLFNGVNYSGSLQKLVWSSPYVKYVFSVVGTKKDVSKTINSNDIEQQLLEPLPEVKFDN